MGATYLLVDCGYETPCWIWQGTMRGEYGQKSNPAYSRTTKNAPKMIGAHVYYYEQKYGPVPFNEVLHHKCEVKRCCNPDHCEPKTQAGNMREGRQAILTEIEVIELRKDLNSGMRQVDAAAKYGISQPTVSQIARGLTWIGV